MGRYVFKLPDVGEGTAEAEIAAWHVKVGDMVEEDQLIVDVMTDKATVELTSPVSGKVVATHGEAGAMAAVGGPLIEFEVEGEGNVADGEELVAEAPVQEAGVAPEPEPEVAAKAKPEPKPEPASSPKAVAAERPAIATRRPGDRPLASPAVRRRAFELGVPLQFVPGSGPGGRITHADLDAYVASGGQTGAGARARYAERSGVREEKVIGLRRKIAEKMQQSKRNIPHFAYVEEVDVTELEALRQHLNANRGDDQPKLTLLPFLMRAVVQAVPDFPQVNAIFDDEAGVVYYHEALHIGIATQTPNGLMVPVVRHAEARDIWDCAAELARVSGAARAGKATREELTGSTITITSLGPLGGVAATPVINHPEVAIIGPNRIIERPVVRDGQITVRKMMNLSSSFDHRIVDGYDAASFIQRLKGLLEHPATIFMD
ncbi:MAG: 2-oxo acid dehydrogenase subunit E2 [Alphaproteobacteria bacterium]|nr:MAG: 2-oxo acid dehydrogenase subunit E2 [Alphaproteobacteria bacterium]